MGNFHRISIKFSYVFFLRTEKSKEANQDSKTDTVQKPKTSKPRKLFEMKTETDTDTDIETVISSKVVQNR